MKAVYHHKSVQVSTSERTYKVGMNEVVGLEASIRKCLEPLKEALQSRIHWNDIDFEQAEYLSRDGFIPHSHNHGGLQLNVTIPKCEEYEWNVEFGEMTEDDYEGCATEQERWDQENSYESEGHLDAHLSIWFKFEGFDDNGKMQFYLVASAGNNDAPYFRNIPTIFDKEFTVSTLKQLEFRGLQAINQLIKRLF